MSHIKRHTAPPQGNRAPRRTSERPGTATTDNPTSRADPPAQQPTRPDQPCQSNRPTRPDRPGQPGRPARPEPARPTDRPAQSAGPPRPVPAERSSPAAPGQSNAATVGTVRQGGNTQRPHGRQATTRTGNRAANRQSGDTDREPRGRPTESAIRTKRPRGELTGCSSARRTGPRWPPRDTPQRHARRPRPPDRD